MDSHKCFDALSKGGINIYGVINKPVMLNTQTMEMHADKWVLVIPGHLKKDTEKLIIKFCPVCGESLDKSNQTEQKVGE